MAIVDHQLGEGYSEHHKVPNVWEFREQQRKRYEEADRRAQRLSQQASSASAEDYDDYDAYRAGSGTGKGQPLPATDIDRTARKPDNDSAKQDDNDEDSELEDVSKIPRGDQAPKTGKEEKEDLMKKNKEAGKKSAHVEYQGERIVKDPVTGQDVIVKDADFGDYDPDEYDPKHTEKPGPSTKAPPRNPHAYDTLHASPKPASPTNILLQPFPAPVDAKTFTSIRTSLNTLTVGIGAGLGLLWFLVAFRAGFWAFIVRSTIIGTIGVGTFLSVGLLANKLEKDIERARAEMHRRRGINHTPPVPESTEWLNAMLATVWPLIDPSLFTSVVDMVEDIMQASLPAFVDAIRISDLGLGDNSLRIIAMRGLPDQVTDKEYPREEWIYKARPEDSQVNDAGGNANRATRGPDGVGGGTGGESRGVPNAQHRKPGGSDMDKIDGEREREAKVDRAVAEKKKNGNETSLNDVDKSEEELDQSGDYVNYEVSLAYQAKPGKSQNQRAGNIHLMIEFFLGAFDWLHIPVPIWIQVEGLIVTARLRVQMVPQPPYIRNLTFTLMGVPKIDISAIPMSKALPNVLDLPIISGFVQSAVAAAANEYVAPKSMTLNMAQMLMGDGIKKDTLAQGVFVVTLHYATDLSAQDKNTSDPYIVLSYAKFGKPMYSTRIIEEDLNPVWEETAVLLVSADEVKAKESLSIQLWDNDKMSADDLVGRVHVPLEELMKEPGKVNKRTDNLQGFEDANEMRGSLTWSIAYYEKAKLDENLRTEKGTGETLPDDMKDQPNTEQQPTMADNKPAADALHIPPRKDLKSGVFSVIIHQINSLERQNLKGATGSSKKREGKAGQDTDAPEEEGPNLPNSYCEIYVNDAMIYKTRTKMYTSMPFFEAGTEVFVRDWTTAVVRIAVRDARLREHDPVLGIISAKLVDLFQGSSQLTQMMAIQEGVGFGRVNCSFLFKAVEAKLPRQMLGWDTATVELLSDITLDTSEAHGSLSTKKLKLHTHDSDFKVRSKSASIEGDRITWDIGDDDIRMPVYNRYANCLHFELGGSSLNPLASEPDAIAVLWLRDLVDDEEKEVRIPVLKGPKMSLLRENYLCDKMLETHEHEIVGHITCTVRLEPGLDPDHEMVAQKTNTNRHEFEVFDKVEGQAEVARENAHANDDGVVDKHEQKRIDKAHQKALESRHRGKMQFSAVRTAVWMKDGLRSRKNALKAKLPGGESKKAEPRVESEI